MLTTNNACASKRFSEGGYSALAAADGFNQNGIKVLKVFASGAPIKLASSMIFNIFATILNPSIEIALKLETLTLAIYALLPYSLRSDIDDAGQGVVGGGPFNDLFHDQCAPSTYTDTAGAWNMYVATKYSDIFTSLSSPALPFFNLQTLTFFNAAVLNESDKPCESSFPNSPTSLCEVLLENDLEKSVENASYDIALCHSTEDALVSYGNAVEPRLVLAVKGNHRESGVTCQYNMFRSFHQQSYKKPKAAKFAKSTNKSPKGHKQLRKATRV